MIQSKNQSNKDAVLFYVSFIGALTRTFTKGNPYYVLIYVFVHYLFLRMQRLLQQNFTISALPDNILKHLIMKHCKNDDYVDYDSCALGDIKRLNDISESTEAAWYYICCKKSARKYKLLIVPFDNGSGNTIFVSETMKHNIDNTINSFKLTDSYFMLRSQDDFINFAIEAKVSMISSPYDCGAEITDALLQNYFSVPRYLRPNDVFRTDAKEHAEAQIYSSGSSTFPEIYFKVKSLRVNDNNTSANGCFIVYGETTLIQEVNINNYLPRKHSMSMDLNVNDKIKNCITTYYPPILIESLKYLESCILPFTTGDIRLDIKPVFLISGPVSCGKRTLIRACAERMGLNLLKTDFAEVQTLTSAQTEAKLRIVLHNAEQCAPCILCLSNIQIFGKNSEGEKDERIISAFAAEIKALYNKNLKFPIIIVITSDGSDLSAELERIFIEIIRMEHLDHYKRTNLLSWILANKKISHEVDLSKITSLCSDFRFADLTALTLHAVKNKCKRVTHDVQDELILTEQDFNEAYEYMQSVHSKTKETPRVPKVHWNDIGGLADLKHEIMRRIQLPLSNAFGFQKSGLLLYGPPGTGKTLLAKAVATEYRLHFLSIKGPEVLNMYVGQSEKNVRQIFEQARASAPCIIFFDELDSLAPNRGRSGDSGGVMDRVVSQLLSEMDGLEGSNGIFIIGATNRPDLIDPALLRPGRFDKMLYVGIHSDSTSQLSVLKALTRKFKLKTGQELEELIHKLPNYVTGADLYAVCSDAWLHAARRVLSKSDNDKNDKNNQQNDQFNEEIRSNEIIVELEDFIEAVSNLVPSISKEEAERYERMRTELSSK